jgi:hypothetical protein
MMRRICLLESCQRPFEAKRKDNWYCCPTCGNTHRRQMQREKNMLKVKPPRINDHCDRSTIKGMEKYMVKNPLYFQFVARQEFTPNNLNDFCKGLNLR